MEALSDYVVVIVMAICLAIGYIIKHFLPLDNKRIPLVMGVLGILLNTWVSGWAFTPQILLGGLASGLAATGAFELVKNVAGSEK